MEGAQHNLLLAVTQRPQAVKRLRQWRPLVDADVNRLLLKLHSQRAMPCQPFRRAGQQVLFQRGGNNAHHTVLANGIERRV